MDCLICIEPMTTKSYISPSPDDDDTVDEHDLKCNRLKCGHAFHSSCIFSSFRAGLGCPVCRESSNTTDDLLLNFDSEDPIVSRLDKERINIRINCKDVRNVRKNFNKNSLECLFYENKTAIYFE